MLHHAASVDALRSVLNGPVLVDLDDLASRMYLQQWRAERSSPRTGSRSAALRRRVLLLAGAASWWRAERTAIRTANEILEAWHREVPVVSTTIGAYGHGATDGEHLLLADHPDTFAAAIERVLDDEALRSQLVERGRARTRSWSPVQNTLRRVAASMLAPHSR